MSIREKAVDRVTRQIIRNRHVRDRDEVRQVCWSVIDVAEDQAKKLPGDSALSYVLYRRALDEIRRLYGWKRKRLVFVSAEHPPQNDDLQNESWSEYRNRLSYVPHMGASQEYLIHEWCDGLPMRKINMAKRLWVDGLSCADVGIEFGISESRVRQLLKPVREHVLSVI